MSVAVERTGKHTIGCRYRVKTDTYERLVVFHINVVGQLEVSTGKILPLVVGNVLQRQNVVLSLEQERTLLRALALVWYRSYLDRKLIAYHSVPDDKPFSAELVLNLNLIIDNRTEIAFRHKSIVLVNEIFRISHRHQLDILRNLVQGVAVAHGNYRSRHICSLVLVYAFQTRILPFGISPRRIVEPGNAGGFSEFGSIHTIFNRTEI